MIRLTLLFAVYFTIASSIIPAQAVVPASSPPMTLSVEGPGAIREEWTYISENSVVIYWQNTNPTISYVEYGTTKAYGHQTEKTDSPPQEYFKGLFDRPYYTQVHRLRDLKPGTIYHYRMICMGTDGKEIKGPDRTLQTKRIANKVLIPGNLTGPPYVLEKSNVTYLLTKDINADGTAIDIETPIKAANVTLDFNGHTVAYGNAEGEAVGVKVGGWHKSGIRIVNGVIRQGKASGRKCNPFETWESDGVEVAGVDITYDGPDCRGIFLNDSRGIAHHNVVFDRGTHISDRHIGLDAIYAMGKSDHNLVVRARHRGLTGGSECAFNEIYLDSWDTNSFGVYGGLDNHNNKIFGAGYMPEGIGSAWGNTVEPKKIHNNYIEMIAQKIANRSNEYGEGCSLSGLRVTTYQFRGENLDFYDNTVILRGQYARKMRGIWVSPTIRTKNIVFRNNYIKVVADDTCLLNNCQVVSICGESDSKQDSVIFDGNTFVSNICHVRLGESYGSGCNVHFLSNVFIREEDRVDYHTIRCGWWVLDTFGHVFRDSEFKGGAGYDAVAFEGGLTKLDDKDAKAFADCRAVRDFTIEWTLTVKTGANARITINDVTGQRVFEGQAGKDGMLSVPLVQYKEEGMGDYDKGGSRKSEYTPHSVTVEKNGRRARRQVTMDRKQTIEIDF